MTTDTKPKSISLTTGKVRLSYAYVFSPHSSKPEDKPKYSVAILFPKSDHETLKKVKAGIEAAKEQGKKTKWEGTIPSGLWIPLRDGDEKGDPNYKDHWYFSAKSDRAPSILDIDKNQILDKTEIYSGCYARVNVDFYPYAKVSKGVGVGLNAIQKLADGEPLSSRRSHDDDFTEPVEDFLA
jgi:hypothetical protein